MTFGEKLKEARKKAGLSQEELAEKISVSRSAVAKWESDAGMPDIANLKALASLLGVSIDYLLDDGRHLTFSWIKESADPASAIISGRCRNKKDAVCYEKYSDADEILPLIRRKKLNGKEFLLDLFTSFGASQIADYANNPDAYYLVIRKGRQLLVRVSDEFIMTHELAEKVDPKRFAIGDNIFSKSTCRLI